MNAGILRKKKTMPPNSRPKNVMNVQEKGEKHPYKGPNRLATKKDKDKMDVEKAKDIEMEDDHINLIDFKSLLVQGGKPAKAVKRGDVVAFIKQEAAIINEMDDL